MNFQGMPLRTVSANQLANWALIAAGIVAGVNAATSVALPFGWDHGIMASVGNSYVQGKLPYSDSWDMKGPVAFLPYSLVQELFGPTMWGIRILDVVIQALAALTIFKGVRSLTTWRVGAWAAFAIYFWVAAAGWLFTATPESWVGALCTLAVVPLLVPGKPLGLSRLASSGLLVGCVGLIKPFYFVVGIAPLLSILLAPGLAIRRRATIAAALAVGAAAPVALVCGYFVLLGGVSQAIEVHILYTLKTYSHVSAGLAAAVYGTAAFLAQPTVALLAPFVALGVWANRKDKQQIWPALAWLAAMLFCVAVQGKYWFYQWLPVYAPMLFLAALGASALARVDAPGHAPIILTVFAALVFAGQVCALPLHDTAKFLYYFGVKHARSDITLHFITVRIMRRTSGRRPGTLRRIRMLMKACLFGATTPRSISRESPEPVALHFRNAAHPARPLSGALPRRGDAGAPHSTADTGRWRHVAWRHQRGKPGNFPELAAFLHAHYHLEKSFGFDDLYRRNAPPEVGVTQN